MCVLLALAAITSAAPAATITSVRPSSGNRGDTITFYVYGSGFASGAQVFVLVMGLGNVPASGETVSADGTRISCKLFIPTNAYPSTYPVAVQNPGKYAVYKEKAFTVTKYPSPTGISPSSASRGQTITAYVSGYNFVAGTQVFLKSAGGGTTIVATEETTLSATQIRCKLTIPSAGALGSYLLGVGAPGTSAMRTLPNSFTVTTGPTVSGISPSSAKQGQPITARVTGTSFKTGAQVRLFRQNSPTLLPLSTTIEATGESVRVSEFGDDVITCNLIIPTSAPIGSYQVQVQNPGQPWVSKPGAFTVLAGTPPVTVASISPSSAIRMSTVSAVVSGTNFKAGAQVKLMQYYNPLAAYTISATGEYTVNPGQIRCSLYIPSTARIGSYGLYVQNPGEAWVSKLNAFTVTGVTPTPTPTPTPTLPTITSISPNWANRATNNSFFYVNGNGFKAGAQFWISGGGTTIQAQSESTVSATQIRGLLYIPANAYIGTYTLYVQNPGQTAVYRAGAFTVKGQVATITRMTPSSVQRPSTGSYHPYVYIDGSGFATGAKVWIVGSGTTIQGTGVEVRSSSLISCYFTIIPTTYVGPYTVYVQNPGQTAVYRAGAFTVTQPVANPVVTSMSPASAAPGQTITAYFYGSGFTASTQVWVYGGGTTISGLNEYTLSSTTVRCTLTIPSTAYRGTYNLYAQNPPLTTYGSHVGGFTVIGTTPVTVTRVTPNSDYYATNPCSQQLTIDGSGFVTGAQVTFIRSDGALTVAATSEVVQGGSRLTCYVNPSSFRGLGTAWTYYDVRVTNPSGAYGTLGRGFSHYILT